MKDAFQAEVRRTLTPLLEPLGFRQHGRVWNRRRDGGLDILELQRSQYNVTEASSFTVNLGIVPAATVAKGVFAVPSEPWPQTRLGFLTPQNKDVWYDYRTDDADILREAIKRAGHDITEYGLPWMVAQSRPFRTQFKVQHFVVGAFARFGVKLREPGIRTLGTAQD